MPKEAHQKLTEAFLKGFNKVSKEEKPKEEKKRDYWPLYGVGAAIAGRLALKGLAPKLDNTFYKPTLEDFRLESALSDGRVHSFWKSNENKAYDYLGYEPRGLNGFPVGTPVSEFTMFNTDIRQGPIGQYQQIIDKTQDLINKMGPHDPYGKKLLEKLDTFIKENNPYI